MYLAPFLVDLVLPASCAYNIYRYWSEFMSKPTRLPRNKKCDVDQKIRQLATGSTGRFFFLNHAEMRMVERGITRRQVFNVVRDGKLVEGPEWCSKVECGWLCKYHWITGGAAITVVVKLIERSDEQNAIVITTF